MLLNDGVMDFLNNINRISITALIIILFFVAFIKLTEFSTKNKKKKIKILKKAPPDKAHGILFGKQGNKVVYSPVDSEGSVGVFSATGTGKTTAEGIPTLRSWTGTSFVIDISGDINKNCPGIKQKLVFEPEDPDTIPYHVFGPIDAIKDPEEQDESLAKFVHLLAPDMPELSGAAKYFYEGGQAILLASFISFYHQKMDFEDICIKIYNSSWKDLFNEIDQTGYSPGIAYLSSFDPDRPTDNAGCMGDAKKIVEFFATNTKVKRSIRRPKKGEKYVVPRLIEKYSIMIVIEDDKLELYSPLLNLIVSQQMQYISSRKVTSESKQILLFLDEYASLRIEKDVILAALRKYRKKKCRLMICTQNLADLDLLYGHEATRAILANLKFKVLLGGLNEPESQEYFAKLIGFQDKKKHSTSTNSHTVTDTESETREYVIEPAELDRQGSDTVILLFNDGDGYLKLKKNYYFK